MIMQHDGIQSRCPSACAVLIVVFIAIFSRKFKWDQYEQRYIELLARKERLKERRKIINGAAFTYYGDVLYVQG